MYGYTPYGPGYYGYAPLYGPLYYGYGPNLDLDD
jgi:hypothetical protein